jgi:hypothetical protein
MRAPASEFKQASALRPIVLVQVAIAISTDPQDIGSAFFIGMKAAIGAAFGVACAPSTIGTRIDVGEGKQYVMRVTLYPIPLEVSGAQTDRPELAKLLKCLGRVRC